MRYRIHFEPIDVEAIDRDHALESVGIVYTAQEEEVTVSRVILIDEDGFPINLEKVKH